MKQQNIFLKIQINETRCELINSTNYLIDYFDEIHIKYYFREFI